MWGQRSLVRCWSLSHFGPSSRSWSALPAKIFNGRRLAASFGKTAYSDLLSNAARGKLAEYIVGYALDACDGVRTDWDAYDLRTPEGWKVEVKSGAYWQSWPQRKPSKIVFGIQRALGWNAEDDSQFEQPTRAADVYAFAVLAHMDKATIDPLDVSQWDFYVLPTAVLENSCAEQRTITLSSLLFYEPIQVKYGGLREAVAQAVTCGQWR